MAAKNAIQVKAAQTITNAKVLESIAPSLFKWLEETCPGLKVANMVNEYGMTELPEKALSALNDANKWIAVATIANQGKADKEALTRTTAPAAMISLVMGLLTMDAVEALVKDSEADSVADAA